ncbi:MAG: hypothetical protein Q7I94_04370 [Candidatus Contubernalis sp.]|nr:hypothetical protein [Candidatus Contubernalis sp.]
MPCVYLLEAVRAMPEALGDLAEKVEFKEWDMTNKEDLKRFLELNICVFPSIVINGEIIFNSEIPSHEVLLEAIRSRIFI